LSLVIYGKSYRLLVVQPNDIHHDRLICWVLNFHLQTEVSFVVIRSVELLVTTVEVIL